MIINNIERIKKLLEFDTTEIKDTFYFLQIMIRRKDNPEVEKGRNNDARTLKHYYIDNMEYFDSKLPEIIQLCEMFNARAYISLSKKSYEQIAFELLKEVSENIYRKNYKKISNFYSSCCGKYSKEKLWLVDYDSKDSKLLDIVNCINASQSAFNNKNVVEILETISGYHIITRPFDTRDIKDFAEIIDLHKDNPTLLYFKEKKK